MSDFTTTQQLIKCNVSHHGTPPSTKFIELEFFKAWAYIMLKRHGLVVSDMQLRLWVNMTEYTNRKAIYDKLEQPESVDRIELLISRGNCNSCCDITRFTFHNDVDTIQKIMLSHLSEDIRSNSKNYQFVLTTGYTFKMKGDSENLLLSLEESDSSSLF